MIKLKIFGKDGQKGGILIEFALIFPICLLLTFPVVDIGRFILLQEKVVRTAYFVADAIAMSRPISTETTQADIDTDGLYITEPVIREVVNSVSTFMMPFPAEQPGGPDLYQVVVTHVYNGGSGAQIAWQYDQNSQSFYSASRESEIGLIQGPADIGSPATMPADLDFFFNTAAGMNFTFVVAEVTASYEPITPNLAALGIPFLQPQEVRYTSYFYARHREAYGANLPGPFNPGTHGFGLKCIWNVYMPPPDCPPL